MKTNNQIAGECSWCRSELNATVYGLGASYSEPIQSDDTFYEVRLPKSDRHIHGAVVHQGSRAFNEGYHLLFAACSGTCVEDLNAALACEGSRFEKRAPMNTDS